MRLSAWLPGPEAWTYSAVTFAAAALALWIALATGLDRPYWAATTVYIVAQPSAGALRAKAVWRLCGTCIGGLVAALLVPALVTAPPLLVAALALWIGACVTASLLDPTPRSYGFMLAGYTSAIIGFPSVTAPGATFETALLRVEEISLGIACAWALHATLLPRPTAPLLLRRLEAWTADVAKLAADALSGDAASLAADRRRLARDGTALDAQFQQARYEAEHRAALRWLPGLRDRARRIPVVAGAAADRLAALRNLDAAALPALAPLLEAVARWMREAPGAATEAARDAARQRLDARLAAAEAEEALVPGWAGLLREGLLARLRELVRTWSECLDRSARLSAAASPSSAAEEAWRLPGHVDPMLVALSGAAVMAAVAGCSAFWILSGWPSGATATMLAAVGGSLFAGLDDPVPAIRRFMEGVVVAVAMSGVLLFAILPAVDGFVLLILVLGSVYLPLGALLAVPALAPRVAPVAVNGFALLAIQGSYAASLPDFLDGALAMLIGFGSALVATRMLRSLGVAQRVRRLVQADRRDLAHLAGRARPPADLRRISGAMLDRFEALAARLGTDDATALGGRELAELRAALNVLRLRHAQPQLPPGLQAAVEDALAATVALLDGESPAATLPRLDAALGLAVMSGGAAAAREAAQAISGLRMALLPEAPPPALPRMVAAA